MFLAAGLPLTSMLARQMRKVQQQLAIGLAATGLSLAVGGGLPALSAEELMRSDPPCMIA